MVLKGLIADPNNAGLHVDRANLLYIQGRLDEAVAEAERALALDSTMVKADANLGLDYLNLGQFEKSLEFFDNAIHLSPHDPDLAGWYSGKASAYFGLNRYDQAIEWARRAIAINPNHDVFAHVRLIAALALSGYESEAHEALQRYLSRPTTEPKTIAAWKVLRARFVNERSDPRFLELSDRGIEGLRKAGMPEE